MAFTPPGPMLNGKSGWHIFQAAVETRDMLRTKALNNILVHWYVQDGLHADQFGRRQAGRHELFYDVVYGEDRKDPLAAEKDIVLCWRCTLHVASSGIHWGQLNATASSSTLDDIHIGIKSLRNSSVTMLELVDPFVQEHVRFTREPP